MPEPINEERRQFIRSSAAALGVARLGVIGSAVQQMACAALTERDEGVLPSLSGATEWLNSPPLTPAGLRGKVVLVDFWTYTCVNWLRTLPYVRAWADKYRDQGLVVIGAHTPEFPFEKDIDNVRWAAKEMDVRYPIAVDSDYGVWRAFDNNYWPAVYVADVNGRIQFHHFGEGNYDGIERVIQRLLRQRQEDRRSTCESQSARSRGCRRLWYAAVAGELSRLREGRSVRVRCATGRASFLHRSASDTQSVGTCR